MMEIFMISERKKARSDCSWFTDGVMKKEPNGFRNVFLEDGFGSEPADSAQVFDFG